MKFAIVDIETNGASNRITEIAVIIYDGAKVINEFQSLVNPGGRIPGFITALTGITQEMVLYAPSFDEIASSINEITQDCIFVAHSVNFDYNIVHSEFKNCGINFQRKKLCSVRLSRKVIPGHKSYSLGNICGNLGIKINGRHRAYGDAYATLELIQYLQKQENFDLILNEFLHAHSRESTIPAHLDKNKFENLPASAGIYQFYNEQYQLIYVGKAKNIKKRVLSHFYSKSKQKSSMLREIAHVDYQVSGTELIALLMEDAAIKRNFPKYNKASKDRIKGFAIISYHNRKGILNLGIQDLKKAVEPHKVFYSLLEARMIMENLVETYHLCAKYCQLLKESNNCKSSIYNSCQGICIEEEKIEIYNQKVNEAIAFLTEDLPNGIIKQKGRNANEDAFIRIQNGKYCGYGFVEKQNEISNFELDDYLIRENDNQNVRQILRQSMHLIQEI